ncbi:MAG: hypothetical protein ACRD5K_20150, partial [Candidatus Acidiferrales bacterium]
MTPAFWSIVAALAAMMIIPLQYFRRATKHARALAFAAVLVAPTVSYSTWTRAFAMQQRLSPEPAVADSIAVTFEPGIGPSTDSAGIPGGAASLPLFISGLQPESLLLIDRAEIHIASESGVVLYVGQTMPGTGGNNQVLAITSDETDAHTHQRVALPDAVFNAARARPVHIAINYSLSVFRLDAAATLSAVGGDRHARGFGWCKTKVDEEGDDVELGCLKAGLPPSCFSAALENPLNGLRNPLNIRCVPDYAPYAVQVYPDSVTRWGGSVQFRDVHGLAKFPVDGSQISSARLFLKSYRPVVHFTRQLIIPRLRPNDWITVPVLRQ